MNGPRLPYDAALGMFIERPRPVSLDRLAFERWLLERHLGEHEIAGPPSGPIVRTESPGDERAAA